MFVNVAFPISQYQVFTYAVQKQHENKIEIGLRVKAPIGKRKLEGVVVNITWKSEFKGRIKSVSEIIDDTPIFDKNLWKLIEWISKYYVTPIGKAATVIPKNLATDYKAQNVWFVKRTSKEIVTILEKQAPSQYKALQLIDHHGIEAPITILNKTVASPINVCKGLQEKGFVKLYKKAKKDGLYNFSFDPIIKDIELSEDQKNVLKKIFNYMEDSSRSAMLLHGVTGSGKTEVYIRAAEEVLKRDKSVIILLPEIALTPQIAGRIKAVFGQKVGMWHSKLTASERARTWTNICNGNIRVVVGARSAVFTPLKDIGLIIVDEEQEASYKQEEPEPHYNARDVALMRAKISSAKVLLVSATPSLESYYNHIMDKYDYCYLPERFKDAVYPNVMVVDMVKEQEESGKIGQIFSGTLQSAIADRLSKNEQIILLQNRRGYAPILRCRDCGEIVNCPTCSIPLTYHLAGENLQCHFCGYVANQIPNQCSDCNSDNLHLSGTGTQKVEDFLRSTFKKAKIDRLDVDVLKSGKRLIEILKNFNDGKTDILLGTQMIAKGLDFGNVTLVGLINADTGLFLPDFRAGERTFQLIYQAAGRSGRGELRGEVIVQTYNSDNSVIRYASRLDLKKYYNIVIGERKELDYPPFTRLAKAVFSGNNRQKVKAISEKIKGAFLSNKQLTILGPAWCYREKLKDKYRMQFVFKSSKRTDPNGTILHNYIYKNLLNQKLPNGIKLNLDIDPVSLL